MTAEGKPRGLARRPVRYSVAGRGGIAVVTGSPVCASKSRNGQDGEDYEKQQALSNGLEEAKEEPAQRLGSGE